jgi:hypothetical protein
MWVDGLQATRRRMAGVKPCKNNHPDVSAGEIPVNDISGERIGIGPRWQARVE